MVKFICSGPKPGSKLLRFFFHANFDRLAALAEKYSEASPPAAAEIRREFTAILSDICVNDVWKVTSNGRLPETENAVLQFLAAYERRTGPAKEHIQILDLGASDGITSVNLLDAIRRNGHRDVDITVTDLCAALIRHRKWPVSEYRSTNGHPVLLRFGRLGLRLPHSEYRWNWLGTATANWYLGCERFRAGMVEDLRISLINPSAACDPAIRTAELDCLKFEPSMINRFDLVRASNIITPRYGFKDEKLRQALTNIHRYLRDGGCLVISRNARFTDVESGSVWIKNKDGFAHIEDFGGGSEIKAEVSAFMIDQLPSEASKLAPAVDISKRLTSPSQIGTLDACSGG